MFDLTALRSEYASKLGRRGRWAAGAGISLIAVGVGFLYWAVSTGIGRYSGPLVFSGFFLSIGVAFVVIGLMPGRPNSYPRYLTVDSTGATLDWGDGRLRRLSWEHARSWFELRDDMHAVYANTLSTSPFFMAGPSGLYTSMFPIPEPAFVRLLEGARGAGVEIVSQTGMGRRMPGSILYYVRGRRAL